MDSTRSTDKEPQQAMDRLKDELSATAAPQPSALTFPFTPSDSPAEPVELAPGIKWLRLPMPFALDHVNVYLLRLEKGWLIIDTGMDSGEARGIWEQVFSEALQGEPVVGVYCTHYHVDHVGLAGYLTDRWRVPLFISYQEYYTLSGWPMEVKEVPWQHKEFFRQVGFPDDLLEGSLVMFEFAEHITPLPLTFVRLDAGSSLPVAGEPWRVMIGEGHSPEHAMLYSAERGILFSGDQLLPRITTNISVSVMNPEDEPLSRWFASLDRLETLPEDTLVLPGHGLPFRGARARVAELRTHHERRFQELRAACADRQLSAYQLTRALYPYTLNDFDLQLALGECLAHLRYLQAGGRLDVREDADGVVRYRDRG